MRWPDGMTCRRADHNGRRLQIASPLLSAARLAATTKGSPPCERAVGAPEPGYRLTDQPGQMLAAMHISFLTDTTTQ